MLRANRHCLPGDVWRLTHRYHHQELLGIGLADWDQPDRLNNLYRNWFS